MLPGCVSLSLLANLETIGEYKGLKTHWSHASYNCVTVVIVSSH